jgi:hypothetical protein
LLSAFSKRAREDRPPYPSNETIHPAGEPIAHDATVQETAPRGDAVRCRCEPSANALETIFGFSGENAEIADWLAEQGGLEPPLSRKELSDGKRRGCWRSLTLKFVRNEAGSTSCVKTIRSPSVSLAGDGIGCFADGVCGSAFRVHHLSLIRHIAITHPRSLLDRVVPGLNLPRPSPVS